MHRVPWSLTLLVALLAASATACGSAAPAAESPASDPDNAGGSDGSGDAATGDAHHGGAGDSASGEIALATIDGQPDSLSAHRAPVTVVALWATYCSPCLRELHLVEALYQHYRDDEGVSVLLVSVDEADEDSSERISGILGERDMRVPAFIDLEHALIERVAPRDHNGKAYYAVPMLAVIDAEFGLRRKLALAQGTSEAGFMAEMSPLIEAARRGEPAPPDEPYQAPLGGGFAGKRSITLTVENVSDEQLGGYLGSLRRQIADLYPDLHGHQLDAIMVEVEQKLRAQGGGKLKLDIPMGHTGAH